MDFPILAYKQVLKKLTSNIFFVFEYFVAQNEDQPSQNTQPPHHLQTPVDHPGFPQLRLLGSGSSLHDWEEGFGEGGVLVDHQPLRQEEEHSKPHQQRVATNITH